MAEITQRRTGQFLRVVFELLLDKPEGLPVKDILVEIPKRVPLTAFESGFYPSAVNSQRFEKIVRFGTIGPAKAGWMVKSKGRWFITEEGKRAYQKHKDPEAFFKEASRLYDIWKKNRPQEEDLEPEEITDSPAAALSLEEVQELAWQQIEQSVKAILPYDFQDLVADLLKAMGYFIYWVAPPGKDGGVDIIAYSDPLGAKGPRVKVQVKHKLDHPIPVEPLRAFMATLAADEIGIYVSSGGFTSGAEQEARAQEKRKMTLLDLQALMDLWIQYYPSLTQEARQRLALTPVYFPSPSD
jgi:restriction system protein